MAGRDDGTIELTGRDDPVNRGGLCIKGANAAELLGHPERLRTPLVRDVRGGPLRPAGWDEALPPAPRIRRGPPGGALRLAGPRRAHHRSLGHRDHRDGARAGHRPHRDDPHRAGGGVTRRRHRHNTGVDQSRVGPGSPGTGRGLRMGHGDWTR
ncbi:MAG: hypothetical protein ACRDSM_10820 [Pseudonocardiaceae bacterium]